MKAPEDLFIGTKAVLARPMNRADYTEYRGWELPANENGDDAGMLVEYLDGGQANDERHEGYITWSPTDVFERAYRGCTDGAMTFSQALELLKQGHAVAREGWNGKGMFIYRVAPGRYAPTTPTGHKIANDQADGLVPYGAYLAIKSVDGNVVPWLASQTDILAEDWTLALWWAQPQDSE